MRSRSLFILPLLSLFLLGWAPGERSAQRLNVLLIVVDDLGYTDIGAYNDDTFDETPHIDPLARRGMMFTDGYAANPVCSPSRYSLLTGRAPSRENHTDWFCGDRTDRFKHARYDCSMDTSRGTIGEAFQKAGYATWFGGKWHLGPDSTHWPEHRGFDVNKGGWRGGSPVAHGGGGYFSPCGNPRQREWSRTVASRGATPLKHSPPFHTVGTTRQSSLREMILPRPTHSIAQKSFLTDAFL